MKNRYKLRLLALSLLGLFVLSTTHSARGQCFQPAMTHTVGDSPQSVAVGDFNRDGKTDLAVGNIGDNSVSVLLNNGDGTFQATRDINMGCGVQSVAVGDFNGDGNPDLATANTLCNNVSVRLGAGDGSFGIVQQDNVSVFVGPVSLKVGDFTGDGLPDLVTANEGNNNDNVTLLRNTGNDADLFAVLGLFNVAGNPFSVVVADFNRDGNPDLAAPMGGQGLAVLPGTGDLNFPFGKLSKVSDGEPFSVAVGDVNGDGKVDLVTTNILSNDVFVLLGNGDNTFQAAKNFDAGYSPYSVAVGDVNGDGKPDLITVNYNNDNVSVLLGNGDGTFQAANHFSVGDEPVSVAVGDFNGDGRADLATANADDNTVSVLLNASGPLSFGVSLGGGLTCVGQPLNLTLTPSCPDTGPYTVQLSSAHGSFANPRSLGTLQPGANSLPLPAGLSAGTGYRVRLLYGGGQVTAPSAPFTVSAPAFSVAGVSPSVGGVPACRGGQVTVSFSVPSGSCALPEGRTEAQLSSAHGSFANPTSLGLVEPNVANLVTIPASVAAGTGYRIRLVHAGQASAYSRVFQVKACASRLSAEEAHLAVVPNPAAGGAIRCRVAGMDNPEFSLTTSVGRGVGVVAKTDGSGEWVLRPKQALAAGVYVVQAREGTTRLTTRVLVVE